MARRKQAVVAPSHFVTEPYMEINGFPIQQGDIIKVHNEWGVKFKFVGITTNTLTGSTWVDCFEIFRGKAQQFRAFKEDRIKRIPQKGKRAKRVS
tara:strand:+ start:24223 stop:24507 length:285 start_codon:yes stop_codon:yes gene_type:complete